MEIYEKEENVLLGTVGAIIGAIIGSILWIALDLAGFVASIAAFAIIFCAVKGYELLGKKISKKGIIICIVVTFVVVLLADLVSMGFSIYREFAPEYDITLLDALLAVPDFLTEKTVLVPFLFDLGLGYIFVVAGCFKFVKNAMKNIEQNEQEKMPVFNNYFSNNSQPNTDVTNNDSQPNTDVTNNDSTDVSSNN